MPTRFSNADAPFWRSSLRAAVASARASPCPRQLQHLGQREVGARAVAEGVGERGDARRRRVRAPRPRQSPARARSRARCARRGTARDVGRSAALGQHERRPRLVVASSSRRSGASEDACELACATSPSPACARSRSTSSQRARCSRASSESSDDALGVRSIRTASRSSAARARCRSPRRASARAEQRAGRRRRRPREPARAPRTAVVVRLAHADPGCARGALRSVERARDGYGAVVEGLCLEAIAAPAEKPDVRVVALRARRGRGELVVAAGEPVHIGRKISALAEPADVACSRENVGSASARIADGVSRAAGPRRTAQLGPLALDPRLQSASNRRAAASCCRARAALRPLRLLDPGDASASARSSWSSARRSPAGSSATARPSRPTAAATSFVRQTRIPASPRRSPARAASSSASSPSSRR